MSSGQYIKLDLPDVFEVLVPSDAAPDHWVDYGIYRADEFSPIEAEPNAVVNTVSGSPFFIRAVRVDGDLYTCVDGGGDEFMIRIVEVSAGG